MARPRALVGLAAFVAVDVLLVGTMMIKARSGSVDAADEGTQQTRTTSTAPAIDPEATVLLSVAPDETVVSATRGSCKDAEPAVVRISGNLGKKFTDRPSPVVQVLSLKADSINKIVLTGTDADCKAATYKSADQGRSWTEAKTAKSWLVGPSGVDEVTSPSHTGKPGCDVVSVSATDPSHARAACADGDILGTGSGGKSWGKLGHLDSMRVAVFPAPGNGMALAGFRGCAAQAYTTRDGGRTWSRASCIKGSNAEAIAFNGTTLVALVSGQLYVSGNKGSTWSPS